VSGLFVDIVTISDAVAAYRSEAVQNTAQPFQYFCEWIICTSSQADSHLAPPTMTCQLLALARLRGALRAHTAVHMANVLQILPFPPLDHRLKTFFCVPTDELRRVNDDLLSKEIYTSKLDLPNFS